MNEEQIRALIAQQFEQRTQEAETVAEVLNAEQAAAFLGVDRTTVYEYAGRGEIPHRRLGRRLLFSRSALVAWLSTCKVASSRKG